MSCAKSQGLFYIELEETPFYFESGGQIGDSGKIYNKQLVLEVLDVQKINNKICHICELKKGEILSGYLNVTAAIDVDKRKKIMANHTATHLLHRALKNIIGNHVQQAGSLVSDDKLRFDYTHSNKLSEQEIIKIEKEVEKIIEKNISVENDKKSYESAINDGAEALFGEKYEDTVRVVTVDAYSKELCGGTHVTQTSEIRFFKIISDSSLASGVRRIEALTSVECAKYYAKNNQLVQSCLQLFNCSSEHIYENILKLLNENKALSLKLKEISLAGQGQMLENLLESPIKHDKIKIYSSIVENDFDENTLSDNFGLFILYLVM